MSDPSPSIRGVLADNVGRLRERIAAAARASGREPTDVTLVAVTKSIPAPWIAALVEAGCHELGESRPQELWAKAEALDDLSIRWHFIGHMQRNKLRRTLPLVSLFQSIDSRRLLAALSDEAAAAGRRVPALVEVNISGDANKEGFAPAEVEALLAELSQFTHVEIQGLMGMAGLEATETDAERQFAALRALRDRLAGHLPPGLTWPHLSMGMSGDFEAAIRQGATLVRIGSALVEGLSPE